MTEHKPGKVFASSVNYPIHPAAEKFPLEQEKLHPLIEDVRANGLHDEIELLAEDGKLQIIDGRRRNEACRAAKVARRYKIIETDSPGGYVWSKNGDTRRHLPTGALVLIAVECEAFDLERRNAIERKLAGLKRGTQQPEVKKSTPRERGKSRDLIGAQIGVSGFMVDQARRVSANAIPKVKEAVRSEAIKLNKADAIARLPASKQSDALKQAIAHPKRSAGPKKPKPKKPTKGAALSLPPLIESGLAAIESLISLVRKSTLGTTGQRQRAVADLQFARRKFLEGVKFLDKEP